MWISKQILVKEFVTGILTCYLTFISFQLPNLSISVSVICQTLKSLRLTQALLSIKAEDTTINTTD